MITFLDLLVIVSMAIIASSLLSVMLMFLIKNKTFQHVCFFIAAALNVYVGYVGVSINRFGFGHQAAIAVILALVAIASLVAVLIKRKDPKIFLIARIAVAASLIVGVVNALLI